MHVHKGFPDLCLKAQTDSPTVHPGNRASLRANFPPEPNPIRTLQKPLSFKQRVHRLTFGSFQAEITFHDCPIRAFANTGGIHARTQDRPKRVKDDRFSRACFSSENDETGTE